MYHTGFVAFVACLSCFLTVPAFVNSSLTATKRTAKRGEDAHVACFAAGDAPLVVTWDLLGHGFTKEQQSRLKVMTFILIVVYYCRKR